MLENVKKRTDGVKFRNSALEKPEAIAEPMPERVKTVAEGQDLTRQAGFLCGTDIEPLDMRWLWPPYIPSGMLSAIEGDPGVGKSWLTGALCASITTGNALPGCAPTKPGKVFMMSGEDSLPHTMIPRLKSLGADLSRCAFPPEDFSFGLNQLEALKRFLYSMEMAVVFIDPIQHYLGGDIDMNKANEVRVFLSKLNALASATGCAIVIVRHLRKAGGGTKIYRGLGSIDFVAACRSSLQVSREDGAEYACVEHVKCNVGPMGPPMGYSVRDGVFSWVGEVDPPGRKKRTRAKAGSDDSTMQIAREFIHDFLRDGPRLAKEAQEAAIATGISVQSLVKVRMEMASSRKTGKGWEWSLNPDG